MIDDIEAVKAFRAEQAPPSPAVRRVARQRLDRAITSELRPLTGAEVRPCTGRARRTRRLWTVAGAAGVAAAVVGALLVLPSSSGRSGGSAPSANSVLRNEILTAFDSVSSDVLQVHQTLTASDGTALTRDQWSMLGSGQAASGQVVHTLILTARAGGAPIQDVQATYTIPASRGGRHAFNPTGDVIAVDYLTGTWSHQADASVPGPPVQTNPDVVAVGSLQQWIAGGRWSQTGTTTFEGQPVIELTQTAPPGGIRLVAFVSEATDLPVHEVFTYAAGHGSDGTVTTDLGYLPPTAANEAELQVAIPAGFTQTATPASVASGG